VDGRTGRQECERLNDADQLHPRPGRRL
jgi:hypothetical protein